MTDPHEWTEALLLRMIHEGIEESLVLEYKASAALGKSENQKKEISKDVSAFANATGGQLIYAVAEVAHKPTKIDDGVDSSELSKEWLEDVITGNIQPKVDGLRIVPVPLPSRGTARVAYVVAVPQSTTAHQARDRRYYKRRNFKAEPMDDYEIRDVMNRVKHPILEPRADCRRVGYDHEEDIATFELSFIVENRGAKCAHYLKAIIGFPEDFLSGKHSFDPPLETTTQISNEAPGYIERVVTVPRSEPPLFPEDEWNVINLSYTIDRPSHRQVEEFALALQWKIFCDDMPPIRGRKLIREMISY